MVYTLVALLRAKDDAESISKIKNKLIEASQTYRNDYQTIDWHVMQSTSSPRDFTIVERYVSESSQKFHLENPYWQTFDAYVVPLLSEPIDLRRYEELETEGAKVDVVRDQGVWERVKDYQARTNKEGE